MRSRLPLLSIVSVLAAGCIGVTNDDPFAYTKQPLFTGAWTLDGSPMEQTRDFFVNDGSIVRLRVEVGGTAEGPFEVTLRNPSDDRVLTVTETGVWHPRFEPGTWTVDVTAEGGTTGDLSVDVTRG